MDPKFGWQKDKYDKRDYLARCTALKVPSFVFLTSYLTPVRDQGNVGSCVGFGIGINFNSVKVKVGIFEEWSSPTFIYNGARYLEGTLPVDIGCRPRNALEWTRECGILDEQHWPYDMEKLDRAAPSSERIALANRYKDFDYFRVVDGIEGLCEAIALGHFVSIGNPWFKEWRKAPAGRLAIPTMQSEIAGGHETCFYGYDTNQGLFYGANSWGTEWGASGLYVMPFEAIPIFKAQGGYDAHYIVFTAEIDEGEPPEPPEPKPCPWGTRAANAANRLLEKTGHIGRFTFK